MRREDGPRSDHKRTPVSITLYDPCLWARLDEELMAQPTGTQATLSPKLWHQLLL